MCKVYGYCRISRKEQNIDRQVRNIQTEYPDAIIIKEAFTGTKVEGREKFEALLKRVKTGDTIVFDSVSRMSRNADEGFRQYMEWYNSGIDLVFLKEHYIDTATYKNAMHNGISMTGTDVDLILSGVNAYLLKLAENQIKIAFDQAEKEVEDLHQRTKEGIETARLAGKQIGQVQGAKLNVKKKAPALDIIRKHSKDFDGTLTDAECMKLAGLARNTFYKYKRELREQDSEPNPEK
ncbi:MAG: recombinase family protein [Bacteroidales bacterium]|nr:recombinase family protein [Bacteroidales bacterium]